MKTNRSKWAAGLLLGAGALFSAIAHAYTLSVPNADYALTYGIKGNCKGKAAWYGGLVDTNNFSIIPQTASASGQGCADASPGTFVEYPSADFSGNDIDVSNVNTPDASSYYQALTTQEEYQGA